MARGKSEKVAPFQKLLTVMVSGKPITIEEIDATLGKEIHMYRLSTYMWHIKVNANGVVKVIKEGRKAVAYQIMNNRCYKVWFHTRQNNQSDESCQVGRPQCNTSCCT
jgi:hypothetical protein